jgi:pimeloyl-ACP methyl ester carboxylesterase
MLLTLTLSLVPALPCPALSGPAVGLEVSGTVSGSGEVVQLVAEDKIALSATYFAPRDKKDRSPAVILVHDAGADRGQLAKLGPYLQKKGFGVLALDLRGHGASVGQQTPWTEQDPGDREKTWAFAMRDLKAATDFLRHRSDIHTSNLTLIGFGTGCNLVAQYGVRDENVRAVILMSPRGNRLGFNLLGDMEDLAGLPTLLIVSKDARKGAERMQDAVHDTVSEDFIEISVLKSKTDKLLSDRSLNSKLYSWLRNTVLPKRSR